MANERPIDPSLGRAHTDRIDRHVAGADGVDEATARKQAQEDNEARYAEPPRESRGEPNKPPGLLDSIKAMMGIEKEPEPEDEEAMNEQADIGSSIGALYLASPNVQKVYQQAAASERPATMIGSMAANALIKARQQMIGEGTDVNDKIWVADGGVLDDLLDQAFSNSIAYAGYEPNEEDFPMAYEAALQMLKMDEDAEKGAAQQGPAQPQAGGGSALMGAA